APVATATDEAAARMIAVRSEVAILFLSLFHGQAGNTSASVTSIINDTSVESISCGRKSRAI
ncbi:MAG TPA: hypothetical protein VM008_16785, partial [Phycisphaerae bacterium]|nr:hypothetical protein [Phycisphaerae bacterium]